MQIEVVLRLYCTVLEYSVTQNTSSLRVFEKLRAKGGHRTSMRGLTCSSTGGQTEAVANLARQLLVKQHSRFLNRLCCRVYSAHSRMDCAQWLYLVD